jgi:hypothetical protein
MKGNVMKIKVSGAKERRATQLVRELYEQGITVERIYGMYFEWDAINSHKASEEERGRLTVADAVLFNNLAKQTKLAKEGKVF